MYVHGSGLFHFIPKKVSWNLACGYYIEFQENLEMELHKCTDDATSKVNAVLARVEEQGHMIKSMGCTIKLIFLFGINGFNLNL